MPAYSVEVTPRAVKDLAALPRDMLLRVDARILALADDPRPPGSLKLTNMGGLHRVRVGDWRILYRIDDDDRVVEVARVLHRGDAYR